MQGEPAPRGESREQRQLAPHYAYGMQERQPIRVFVGPQRRLSMAVKIRVNLARSA